MPEETQNPPEQELPVEMQLGDLIDNAVLDMYGEPAFSHSYAAPRPSSLCPDPSPRRRGVAAPTARGRQSIREALGFGQPVRISLEPMPEPAPRPDASVGHYHDPTNSDPNLEGDRACRTCGNRLPLTNDYFYFTFGRWSLNCRACCDVARANRPSRPSARGRRFGVEIEFYGSRHALAGAMRDAGATCRVREYTHQVSRSSWKVVTDGSLCPDMGGDAGELVSPVLAGEDGRAAIRLASRCLRGIGASVNATCGLHVHHEVTDFNRESFLRLFRFYFHAQHLIDELVAPSRRNESQYARYLSRRDLQRVEEMGDEDRHDRGNHLRYLERFCVLNATSFPRYGTIEFRQHHGTTSGKKILAWVDFTRALVEWARSEDEMPDFQGMTLPEMLRMLDAHGLPAASADFLLQRAIERCANEEPENLPASEAAQPVANPF